MAAEKNLKNLTITQNTLDIPITLTISKISPIKFNVKGPPKLPTIKINHRALMVGTRFKYPLLSISLREYLRSYIIFACANIPDEPAPCAIIIIIPPSTPHLFEDKNPAITNAMWTTESRQSVLLYPCVVDILRLKL